MNSTFKDSGYLRNFSLTFMLRTEGITFLVIIPLIVLYLWANLKLTDEQLRIMLFCAALASAISLIGTVINDVIVLRPVAFYFSRLRRELAVADHEYERALRRFLLLPYIHGVGALLRFAAGILLFIVPLQMLTALSQAQIVNMWMLILIYPPSVWCCIFSLPRCLLRKCTISGFPETAEDAAEAHNEYPDEDNGIDALYHDAAFYDAPRVVHNGDRPVPHRQEAGISEDCAFRHHRPCRCGRDIALLGSTLFLKVHNIQSFLRRVGEGELAAYAKKIVVVDELTGINVSVYQMKENLRNMVEAISTSSHMLKESSDDMSNSSAQLSDMANEMSSIVEEAGSAYEQMSASFEATLKISKSSLKNARR
jgi:hypothetical protein